MQRRHTTSLFVGAICAISSAPGQAQAPAQDFDIQAASTKTSLAVFMDSTGVNIIYREADLSGKRSPRVNGRMAAMSALQALLRGTGLVGQRTDSGAIVITPVQEKSSTSAVKQQPRPTSIAYQVASPDAPPVEEGEIIVTAQKRTESLQRIPLAVTALDSNALRARDATTVASLQGVVPNVRMSENLAQPRVTLRGIGVENSAAGAESSIAFNQDGVFYARPSAIFASYYDVARVEVLRGPQGTLYGRNATGGSVNIITNRPTDNFGAGISVTGGNYETINSEGFLNVPLSERVSGRISFGTQHHSGYGRNLVTGSDIDNRDSQSVRAQLLIKPKDELSILLAADYSRQKDHSNAYHQLGGVGFTMAGVPITPLGIVLGGNPSPDPRDISTPNDPLNRNHFYGGRLEIEYGLSDAISVKSLTSYRHSDTFNVADGNPLTIPPLVLVYALEKSKQFSQELQLNVDMEKNKLVAGLYYLNERNNGTHIVPISFAVLGGPNILAQGARAGGKLNTDAVAFYAQDTYSLTPSIRLTLGGRYSWERKATSRVNEVDFGRLFSLDNGPLAPFVYQRKTFKSFTPKIGIDIDIARNTLAYASFSKGFKSGTFGLGNLTSAPALQPEKIDAYEAGIKSTFFDRRVRLNFAGFYYNYKNLQVSRIENTFMVLDNAASARIYGLEGELEVKPVDAVRLYANASWLNARFKNYVSIDPNRPAGDGVTFDQGVPAFDLRGNALPQAPDFSALTGAEYNFPLASGTARLTVEGNWTDRLYFNSFNTRTLSQEPHWILNAYLGWTSPDKQFSVAAYLKNATNKLVWTFAESSGPIIGSAAGGFLEAPRTFGITIGYKY